LSDATFSLSGLYSLKNSLVTGFNDLHNALRKSARAIIRITSYPWGRARHSLHKNPILLLALQPRSSPPTFLCKSTPMVSGKTCWSAHNQWQLSGTV